MVAVIRQPGSKVSPGTVIGCSSSERGVGVWGGGLGQGEVVVAQVGLDAFGKVKLGASVSGQQGLQGCYVDTLDV